MKRTAMIVALNMLAVAAPTLGLVIWFGADEKVDPSSVEHLLALLVCVFFTFVLGLASTQIARRGAVTLFDTAEMALRENNDFQNQ